MKWASRWLQRNKEWFKTCRSKTLAAERKAVHTKKELEEHFERFRMAMQEFGIAREDLYNFDETGFRIGIANSRRIVITHTTTKYVFLADPNNRDFITSVEYICGNGTAIKPMIILKDSVFLEKHFDNNLNDSILFAYSETGYNNEKLGLFWLKYFDNQTKAKTKGKYRILVFDGHGSHLIEDFLVYCWQSNIIPFQLPPYSTHLLQPLDIKVFQPLKHWHQEDIFRWIKHGKFEYKRIDFLNGFQ
jgi:hypothetical protein